MATAIRLLSDVKSMDDEKVNFEDLGKSFDSAFNETKRHILIGSPIQERATPP